MLSRFIEYQKSKVHYTVSGTGPAMMLVHGFGEDGTIWDKQLPLLQQKFTVVIPDLPGSGKSPLSVDENVNNHLSIEDFADILNEIINAQQINMFILIGHSMGGYITLAFAEKWPQMLAGIGLFHSSAFADNDEKKQTRLKAIDFIREKGAAAFLKTTTSNLYSKAFKENHTNELNAVISKYSYFESSALTGYYFAMINRPERVAILQKFEKPVLFLIGDEDTAIPFDASLKQCHLPAQSHVHILQGVGHMGMLEKPEETAKYLVDFANHVFLHKT